MGLDYSPFSYIKVAPTDVETQVLEVAWAGNPLLNAKRKTVEAKTQTAKEPANPLLEYWYEVRIVFRY